MDSNMEPWSFALNFDDSDKSSDNESHSSTRSSSRSSDTSIDTSSVEKEPASVIESQSVPGGSYDIISKTNMLQFVQKIDANSSLDDQGCDMMARIADAFVNDISMRIVKLAKYRKSDVSVLDLKFILKREFNMEFPIE
uniref:Transcription initiation factor TFIID subunit 12 n=1 Tax=Drosophila melanogaster TaxID=7227 RepID=Q9VR21_DROME|eukprot:NP_608852.1 TBP-associated factor 30kD subunit alpha-2 [Drosophila melanogaster]